jgi:hypothetical protein
MAISLRHLMLAGATSAALLLGACAGEPETPEETRANIAAAFEEAKAAAAETRGEGSPALWTLSDDDTTIHIFGTVHILRPELNWWTPAFEAAFEASDTLVFEVDLRSEEAQRSIMTDFMTRGMYDDGRTLTAVLDDEKEAVISAAFDSVNMPISAMNAFEPWMASINLSTMKMTSEGFDPEAGVESVLTEAALARGMTLGYLEKISDQADAFDNLSEETQIRMLYEAALMLDDSSKILDVLVDEWADGDIAGIGVLAASPDGTGFPDEAYDAVLTNRNKKWVPQIEAMLDEPGTVFIAAGAGHFAGPDSVITMLRDKGYTVTGP